MPRLFLIRAGTQPRACNLGEISSADEITSRIINHLVTFIRDNPNFLSVIVFVSIFVFLIVVFYV